MERYYYISDNLNELEVVAQELEHNGLAKEQVRVLSQNDQGVAQHRLQGVTSFMKKDVVRSSVVGAAIGVCLSVLVLLGAWLTGWPDTFTWIPFVLLAIVVLGFCTWEGGLWGIQETNTEFRRFQKVLDHGKHLLLVDVDSNQMMALNNVWRGHPRLKHVGKGAPTPRIILRGHQWINRFMRWAP